MGLTEEVASRAALRVSEIGGLRLVSASDAMMFLDACLAAKVRVLGIEGFRVQEKEAQPDMDAIADFSGLVDSRQSVLEAKRFVQTLAVPEMMFDFTLAAEGAG